MRISKRIRNRVNNLFIVGYLKDFSPNGYTWERVSSLTQPQIDGNFDNLIARDPKLQRDANIYPVGFYANDFRLVFYLNLTNFVNNFLERTDDFNVTIGFSYDKKPSSVTTFDINSINENQTFYWNYTFQTNRVLVNRLQPQIFRWEGFHVSGFIIMFVLCIGTFFTLIIFCKKQPLYSRGIYPYFTTIFQFISLIPVMGQYIFDFDQFNILCMFEKTIKNPLILCSLALPLFGYFRYVLLLNLNFKKQNFVLSKSDFLKRHKLKKFSRSICCLKFLGHWMFHLFLLVATFITIFSIFLIIFVDSYVKKGEAEACSVISLYNAAGTVYGVIFCLIYVLFLFVFIYEIIVQCWMMIKFKKSVLQILKEDVFLFRIEIILIGGFVVLPFMFILFVIERAYLNKAAISSGQNYLVYSILSGFQYQILFFMNCGFVLFVTILKTFLDCCSQKPSMVGEAYLDEINDEQLQSLFRDYLESEFSVENLICYNDIQKYKRETVVANKEKLAQDIYSNYFNGSDSTLEVNVDQRSCEIIKKRLDEGLNKAFVELENSLFDPCEKTVKTNLYDSFSRFVTTSAYAIWKNREKELKDLQ